MRIDLMKNRKLKVEISILFIITVLSFILLKADFYKNDVKVISTEATAVKAITATSMSASASASAITIEPKRASTKTLSDIKLIPGGQSIGVKLNIDGIFVVGFSDIETKALKKQSPAMLNGIKMGDSIIDVNGQKLDSSRQLSYIINDSLGKVVNFKIKRNTELINIKVKPIMDGFDNHYKVGLWVRDSTAGVGTLTFIEPKSHKFGALGHPINDVDTELLLPVKDGKIFKAKIISVEFGEKGKPGELRGMFSNEDEIGLLQSNTNEGIYGKLNKDSILKSKNMLLSIAGQHEVEEGPATILTSLDGVTVKEYKVNIERHTKQDKPNSKGMVLRITDQELLSRTGGIVQGMSGSPIIQNKKIIGAVTHVFVNKPEMGYGIYIEWMLSKLGIEV